MPIFALILKMDILKSFSEMCLVTPGYFIILSCKPSFNSGNFTVRLFRRKYVPCNSSPDRRSGGI